MAITRPQQRSDHHGAANQQSRASGNPYKLAQTIDKCSFEAPLLLEIL